MLFGKTAIIAMERDEADGITSKMFQAVFESSSAEQETEFGLDNLNNTEQWIVRPIGG